MLVESESNIKPKKDIESGRDLSNKEYLDLILRKSIKNKKISDCVLKFFPDRDLFSFNQSQINNLKQKLTKDSPVKRMKGKLWTGVSFANFIELWIEALNKFSSPNVNNL